MHRVILLLLLMLSLAGCTETSTFVPQIDETLPPAAAPTVSVSTQESTRTISPAVETQPTETKELTPTTALEEWQTLPVIPIGFT